MDIESIKSMSTAEQEALLDNLRTACVLADAMQINGARVMGGDVQEALGRLGLRLVIDSPGLEPACGAAQARLYDITDTAGCDCGQKWVRLRDVDGPGSGWWHNGDADYNDDCFFRKCPDGFRAPARKR